MPLGSSGRNAPATRPSLGRGIARDRGAWPIGPKVQGDPERAATHRLEPHADAPVLPDCPRTFDALRAFLAGRDIEGVVFHHPDGRMGKIKLRDFGLKRAKAAG